MTDSPPRRADGDVRAPAFSAPLRVCDWFDYDYDYDYEHDDEQEHEHEHEHKREECLDPARGLE
jgi:hypothetical protein